MRLGRKIVFSHGDLEALIFTESGQVYVQEDMERSGNGVAQETISKELGGLP